MFDQNNLLRNSAKDLESIQNPSGGFLTDFMRGMNPLDQRPSTKITHPQKTYYDALGEINQDAARNDEGDDNFFAFFMIDLKNY